MSITPEREIILKSSDGEIFKVEEDVAPMSEMIKHIMDDCADDCILLSNVTGKILAKVIEYCKKHVKGTESFDDLKAWDAEFVKDLKVDQATLFDLIMAADYLNIQGLFDLTCKTVTDMMKGRVIFTPDEEAEIRRENQWAFEGYC